MQQLPFGGADRALRSHWEVGLFLRESGSLRPEERNADLSGFRHREGSVSGEGTSQQGSGEVNFAGMVMRCGQVVKIQLQNSTM